MKKPDFFIVGAPKAGTTAMYVYLKEHPQIFMPRKEIDYFSKDLTYRFPSQMSLGDYLEYFTPALENQLCGEASVNNLVSKTAPGLIADFNPRAKIIVMLRNPIDLLYSLHADLLGRGTETLKDFRAALNAEGPRRRHPPPLRGDAPRELLYYRSVGRLSEGVTRFLDTFHRSQCHIVFYEEWKEDLADSYQQTLEFLNIASCLGAESFPRINPNSRTKLVSIELAIQSALNNRPLRRLGRALLPRGTRRRVLVESVFNRIRRINAVEELREPMPRDLRESLIEEFAKEVDALEQLLGRPMPWTDWR